MSLPSHGDQPRHLVAQEHDLEIRIPRRGVPAAFRLGVESREANAHVLVVAAALHLDRAEPFARTGHWHLVACVREGIREQTAQGLCFPIEESGAGGGVEEVAVGEQELEVAGVELLAGVGDVVEAFEAAFLEERAGEADELVDEEVVEVREGFDGGGGGGGGEGDARLEDAVRAGGALVQNGGHEDEGFRGAGGGGGGWHCFRERRIGGRGIDGGVLVWVLC